MPIYREPEDVLNDDLQQAFHKSLKSFLHNPVSIKVSLCHQQGCLEGKTVQIKYKIEDIFGVYIKSMWLLLDIASIKINIVVKFKKVTTSAKL